MGVSGQASSSEYIYLAYLEIVWETTVTAMENSMKKEERGDVAFRVAD